MKAAERVLNGNSTNRVYITCAKLAKHNCRTIVKRCSIKSEVMQSALSHCWENVNYCSRDRSVALLRGDGCLEMCGGKIPGENQPLMYLIQRRKCCLVL